MPNIVTHNYFAKDVLKKVENDVSESFKQKQDIYELFAGGFDPFFVYEQIPFHEKMGYLCHDNYIDIFFLNFIKIIKEEKLENNESVLAALYGHLTHYVLDSIIHPYVMYKTGEYEKDKPETIRFKGLHAAMEMQFDAYIYETREHKKFKDFKIHRLAPKLNFGKELQHLLNRNYMDVFNLKNGGVKYKKSINLVRYGLRFMVEDKTGIKKFLYKQIDKMTPKNLKSLEALSSHITSIDNSIFNLDNKIWYNPWDNTIISHESFFDLYNNALERCTLLFHETYKYIHDEISEDVYKEILKDYSYVTGLSWRIKRELKYTEF